MLRGDDRTDQESGKRGRSCWYASGLTFPNVRIYHSRLRSSIWLNITGKRCIGTLFFRLTETTYALRFRRLKKHFVRELPYPTAKSPEVSWLPCEMRFPR